MKAVITADLHLISELELSLRTNKKKSISDFLNQLKFFDRITELKPELFIIAGDLLDYFIYTPYQMGKIVSVFKKLKEAGVLIILVQGNHDLDYQLLEVLKSYAFVVANKGNNVSSFVMPDFKLEYEKLRFDKTTFHFVNYTESRKLLKKIELEENRLNVLIAHTIVSGLKNDKNTPIFGELTPADFTRFHHVFTGHIHYAQTFKNITVVGSPYLITTQIIM